MHEKKEDSIESKDRVSLIKFNKRLRRIFSLVQKDSNFAQLKNQVNRLNFDEDEMEKDDNIGNLAKALHQMVFEFERHKLIKKLDERDGEGGGVIGAHVSAGRSNYASR